jgi:hemoglobin
MNDPLPTVTEQEISELVKRFYERAAADAELKPLFDANIHNWEHHHQVVADFWSHALLNTDRYKGSPYPLHARLPIRIEHFDIWLNYFRITAQETLPVAAATNAIARAEHMAESFKVGMFMDYFPTKTTACPKPLT